MHNEDLTNTNFLLTKLDDSTSQTLIEQLSFHYLKKVGNLLVKEICPGKLSHGMNTNTQACFSPTVISL